MTSLHFSSLSSSPLMVYTEVLLLPRIWSTPKQYLQSAYSMQKPGLACQGAVERQRSIARSSTPCVENLEQPSFSSLGTQFRAHLLYMRFINSKTDRHRIMFAYYVHEFCVIGSQVPQEMCDDSSFVTCCLFFQRRGLKTSQKRWQESP